MGAYKKIIGKNEKTHPDLLQGERRVKNKKINIELDIEDLLRLK